MREGRNQEPVELRLEQRQVAIFAAGALILLGVVFALGVLVGRQLASATLGAPQQPAPGDLAALDAAQRSPPPAPRIAPPDPKPSEKADVASPVLPRPGGADAKAGENASGREPARAAAPAPSAPGSAVPAPARPTPPATPPAPMPALAAPGTESPPTPDEVFEDDDAPADPPARAETPKAAPAPAKGAPPRDLGSFTVQLGASPDRKVAEKVEARARAAGFNPYVIAVDLGAKGTWYRIRAGAFASKDQAVKLQKDAERQLHVSAVIMPAK